MDEKDLAIVVAELEAGGPSPYIPDMGEPMPVLFGNEMSMFCGRGATEAFGKQVMVSMFVTSFRFILYRARKRGDDQILSFWHDVDFGDWRWELPDGFVIARMVLDDLDFGSEMKDRRLGPPVSWNTYWVNPEGERRLLCSTVLHLTQYHFHQQERMADWQEMITPNGDEENRKLAATWFGAKIKVAAQKPGSLDLDALWRLIEDPLKASETEVGAIPEESHMHPSKATRESQRIQVERVSKGRSGRKTSAKRVIKRALGATSQIKGVVETAASAVETGGKLAEGIAQAGKQAVQAGTGVPICIGCGKPMRPGALFCGHCGQRLVDAAVDHVKGQIEDAVEEKVEQVVETALEDDDTGQQKQKDEGSQEEAPISAEPVEEQREEATQGEQPTPKPEPADTPSGEKSKSKAPVASSTPRTRCPQCGRRIQPKWKFCPDCSQALQMLCPACGRELEEHWKFCPYCTAAINPG